MSRRSRLGRFTRRGFLRLTCGGVIGGMAAPVVDALVIEPWWIDVSRPVIPLANLPAAWDGVRIAHLTDLHVGKLVALDHIQKAVRLANQASPDLIVCTGDFVSRRDVAVQRQNTGRYDSCTRLRFRVRPHGPEAGPAAAIARDWRICAYP